MPLKLKAIGKTDKGLVRSGNEDNLHLDPANHVYVVCDGMGGHQAGEVASMLAVEVVRMAFRRFRTELTGDPQLDLGVELPASTDLLLKSIRLANRAIYSRATDDRALAGMGTTIVAVAFEGHTLTVAHVGDSRAYRLDESQLTPLTTDHSWLTEIQKTQQLSREEASTLVGKNIITRALGVRDFVEVDYQIMKAKTGDIFILCSDGLCGFADDEEIFQVARKHREDISKMADSLVQMANDRGGMDNVTVVVIQVADIEPSSIAERALSTLPREQADTLQAEDGWVRRLEAEPDDTVKVDVTGTKGAKAVLVGLFALFAAVAVLIIYLVRPH